MIDPNWIVAGLLGVQTLYIGLTYHRGQGEAVEKTRLAFRRSALVVGILMLLTWAAVGWDYYDRYSHRTLATQPLVISWGATPGPDLVTGPNGTLMGIPSYTMLINAHPLFEAYGEKHKAMMIVRVPYANVDRMVDTAIEKSAAYTITDSGLAISHPGEGKLKFPSGSGYVEFNLVVIPQDFAPDQITCLADVQKIGGAIIATTAQAITGSPFPNAPLPIKPSP